MTVVPGCIPSSTYTLFLERLVPCKYYVPHATLITDTVYRRITFFKFCMTTCLLCVGKVLRDIPFLDIVIVV
jgi:hypothetical protein